ncbi:MAG: glycoside hydrolase family 65 protein, partial [Treponemataceae bacterium]|nr:glycoside hydrolase family 65 protein [Treponemataceae bacterium]
FYAWESQESGDDACSLFNVIDVFTGRPIRTYFRDKQIHINGDIVYAIKKYIDVTGDWLILKEGAMEVVLECALFYLSYLYYSPLKSRYEILDVTGPDEYHERVNNNVFTNKLVYFTFEVALDFCTFLKEKDESFLMSLFEKTKIAQYLPLLQEVKENLYIPSPNDYGVIEQFDGYFKLEDIPICELRKRVIDPKEYWGGPNGIASFTQVIKQADVITMLYLFKEDYSCYVKKANLQYYEPRTEHGSSLSASMHALLFCDIGETEKALLYFKKTAEIDLTGDSKQFAGLVYIGGTHPAANGGTWLSVVYGFCGFSVKDGKIHLKPCLPNHWKKIVFTTYLHGEKYTISVTSEGYSICSN